MNDTTQSEAVPPQAATPVLWIREVSRLPEQGQEDHLSLEQGVNVLVGVPNTGKSKWLRMIDYLLGDDKKAEEAFDVDVAAKYHTVRATIVVAGTEWTLERTWRDQKLATKISVNGELMTLSAFTDKLMNALDIPILHYPQGDPYGSRSWPALGWRSLFRHMYRRQKFWSDLADQQPPSEQHACILQFVGLAEILFSEEYGKLVTLEKQIQQLKSTREQFVAMLQEVSRDLIDEKGLGVALTPDSIAAAMKRHEADIAAVQERRQATLRALLDRATAPEGSLGAKGPPRDVVEELGRQLVALRSEHEASMIALRRTQDRLVDLRAHRGLVDDELGRMERTREAGTLLADLKITHCPACDRPIDQSESESLRCYLCRRPNSSSSQSEMAVRRLDFEIEQLRAELKETDQLIGVVVKELVRSNAEQERQKEEIVRVQERLRPVRTAAASVLPAELAVFDQDTGRLQERVAQLRRVRATLERRETIAADIEKIQVEVATLESELAEQSKVVSFERAGDLISDGMNTYLNVTNEIKPSSWTQQEVDFVLRDRNFVIRIGKGNWQSKLGGTLTLFFLVGYHYALMTLTGKRGCHFPGFCILDFPPQLDGVAVSSSENFVLEPFVRMMQQPDHPTRQVIAAGSSFAGLMGAHRIELTTVWV